jgi:hypothetical protein
VPAAWLQVRADNEAAFELYRQLGFEERARRSTWQISNLKPGFWSWLQRILTGQPAQHWVAHRSGQFAAALTWERSLQSVDYLWLAAPENEEEAVQALLAHARQRLPFSRHLTVNYPVGKTAAAFEQSGFHLHNTLIWMSVEFT